MELPRIESQLDIVRDILQSYPTEIKLSTRADLDLILARIQDLALALQNLRLLASRLPHGLPYICDFYRPELAECSTDLASLVEILKQHRRDSTKWNRRWRLGRSALGRQGTNHVIGVLHDYVAALRTESVAGSLRLVIDLWQEGGEYETKYQRSNDPPDLDKAIDCSATAVDLLMGKNPLRPSLLDKLACQLSTRHSRSGLATDIDRAVNAAKEAVFASPEWDPDLPNHRDTLANCLFQRYKINGERSDIETAVEIRQVIVAALLPNDGQRDRHMLTLHRYVTFAQESHDTMPLFYKAVPAGCIRLLSTVDAATLCFTMDEFNLRRPPKYTALSYTWQLDGPETGGKELRPIVTINSIPVRVQQNLYHALLHAIGHLKDGKLWVDSLCINQKDNAEKSVQVQQMNRIYDAASSIVAWIGQPRDERKTTLAVALMRQLGCSPTRHYSETPYQTLWALRETIGFVQEDKPETIDSWEGVAEIYERSYWTRAWIWQEMTASVDIIFLIGSHSFGIFDLAATVLRAEEYSQMRGFRERFARILGERSHVSAAIRASYDRHSAKSSEYTKFTGMNVLRRCQSEQRSLLLILSEIRRTECKDARDKVFAGLAHASDAGKNGLVVDYDKPLSAVYAELVAASVREDGLAWLGHVYTDPYEPASGSSREGYMASWIPDWRQTDVPSPLSQTCFNNAWGLEMYSPYPAEKLDMKTSPEALVNGLLGLRFYSGYRAQKTTVPFQISCHELRVGGTVIDTVSLLTESWSGKDSWDTFAPSQPPRNWSASLHEQGAQFSLDAFDRTLVGDVRYEMLGPFQAQRVRGGRVDWNLALLDTPDSDECDKVHRALARRSLQEVCYGRRAGFTKQGRLGIFPAATAKDDKVAALSGGHVLYIIRESAISGRYRFIGECYVDGMMDEQVPSRLSPFKNMTLV